MHHVNLDRLVGIVKPCFVRMYKSSVGLFFDYLEGSDELLDALRGKKWSLETDGDFVILWVEVDE